MRPRSTRLSISPKLVAVCRLSHVHILVARIDRCLVVAGWLLLLDVDRLLGDSAHLVLFDDSVTRDARLACIPRRATVAVEIDAEGDQSTAEKDPLKGAERSSGFGRICRAIGVVIASLQLVAVRVVDRAAVVRGSVDEVPCGCGGGEPGPGPEPEGDGKDLEDELHIFVIGARQVECADLDVAEEEDGPNRGEDADAISSIEAPKSTTTVCGQCQYEDGKKLIARISARSCN